MPAPTGPPALHRMRRRQPKLALQFRGTTHRSGFTVGSQPVDIDRSPRLTDPCRLLASTLFGRAKTGRTHCRAIAPWLCLRLQARAHKPASNGKRRKSRGLAQNFRKDPVAAPISLTADNFTVTGRFGEQNRNLLVGLSANGTRNFLPRARNSAASCSRSVCIRR